MDSRNRSRAGRSPHLIAAIGLCFAFAAPAQAQYMYMDSNGDGVHTSADVVSPRDTTWVSLWLITDRNRDGSFVQCKPMGTASFFGYRAILEALDGTVNWGTFVRDPSIGWQALGEEPADSLHYVVGCFPAAVMPAGKYCLGRVPITVRHGTPEVRIGHVCPVHRQQYTKFLSNCNGWRVPMERTLGGEWKDVDGLLYGGRANKPPVLTAAPAFPVRAGATATYRIEADDRDGDAITFRTALLEGMPAPPWIRVRTVDPGHGHAIGEVKLDPDSCQRYTHLFAIEASDGIWTDRRETQAPVERVTRPVPDSPMGPAHRIPAATPPTGGKETKGVDSKFLLGDWEWTRSSQRYPSFSYFQSPYGPAHTRQRLHLLILPGSFALYQVDQDRSRLIGPGTYTLEGNRITFSRWVYRGETFSIRKIAQDTIGIYPWQASDAEESYYVRVPSLTGREAIPDTLRVSDPLGHPTMGSGHDGYSLTLPPAMREALTRWDGSFRLFTPRDWSREALRDYHYTHNQIPWALIGDFDGDLLLDAAVYGRSGRDEVILAVLSGFGNVHAVEVARRSNGSRDNRPYLELASRDTKYSPCWAREGTPDMDGIGVVSPGVARFDYTLRQGEFVVYAPVP